MSGDKAKMRERRHAMVAQQLEARGITSKAVLDAMREVPREEFVTPDQRDLAFMDGPLPIGSGQTISQPYIVAMMIEAARPEAGHRSLDIGTGSGYAAAVISRIVAEVYSIERRASLAGRAEDIFAQLGYDNIHVRVGDGTLGWPEEAPFDSIIVAAGAPEPPASLRRQLAPGGCLVLPVGGRGTYQHLMRITNRDGEFESEDLGAVAFVPLVGEEGWRDER